MCDVCLLADEVMEAFVHAPSRLGLPSGMRGGLYAPEFCANTGWVRTAAPTMVAKPNPKIDRMSSP